MPKIISDEEIIERIKAVSRNGLAPSTTRYRDLYALAVRRFKSWETACILAGVKARYGKHDSRSKARNEKTRVLALVLHVGQLHGKPNVMKCIGYARKQISGRGSGYV